MAFVASCKRVKLSDADEKFAEGEYYTAAEIYRKVYRQTSGKKQELRGSIAFRQAESNRLANNPMRASASYTNAIRYKEENKTLHLQYARTLHKLGKYKEAAIQYQLFLKMYPTNSFALNGLEGTKIAPVWRNTPSDYKVKRMNLFDSRGSDTHPCFCRPTMIRFSLHAMEKKLWAIPLVASPEPN